MVVAIAIAVAFTLAALGGFASAQRARAHAAAIQFDGLFVYAQALAASSGNGATVLFRPDASGCEVRVYAGRPTSPQSVTVSAVAPQMLPAQISEASLGQPPFALFLDSAGSASALAGYGQTSGGLFPVIPRQPPCPKPGGFTLLLEAGGATERRAIPCRDHS